MIISIVRYVNAYRYGYIILFASNCCDLLALDVLDHSELWADWGIRAQLPVEHRFFCMYIYIYRQYIDKFRKILGLQTLDKKMTKINNQQPSEFAGKIFIMINLW